MKQFALDTHINTTVAGSPPSVAGSAAAAAETAVAGSAAMSGGDSVGENEGVWRTAKFLLQSPNKAWKIPP